MTVLSRRSWTRPISSGTIFLSAAKMDTSVDLLGLPLGLSTFGDLGTIPRMVIYELDGTPCSSLCPPVLPHSSQGDAGE